MHKLVQFLSWHIIWEIWILNLFLNNINPLHKPNNRWKRSVVLFHLESKAVINSENVLPCPLVSFTFWLDCCPSHLQPSIWWHITRAQRAVINIHGICHRSISHGRARMMVMLWKGHIMTKLVLSSQTICSNDNTFILSFVDKKPSLIVKISSICSQDPADSGCEASTPQSPPPGIKIEEPAIQKRFVQVEESVDDALLEELFKNGSEGQVQPYKTQVTKIKTRPDYVLFRFLCVCVRYMFDTKSISLIALLLK